MEIPKFQKGEFLVLDKDVVPMVGNFGRNVELKYPKEFALIDSMAIEQSAVFPGSKAKMVNAIRGRLHKLTPKKFVVKKINPDFSRIWRVADNAVTRPGGADATARAAATNKKHKKGKWGGYRPRGPKLTNKDGTPIVPVVNVNNVPS
jgi:hypothetical protein